MKTKKCGRCGENKTVDNFGKFKSGIQKGIYRSYCKKCDIEYKRLYRKNEQPWDKKLRRIKARCSNNGIYRKRHMIQNYLTSENIKFLWFRDRAFQLKKPSIDRIDTYGNYTLKNCRFIELSDNLKRPRRKRVEAE